MLTSMRQNPAIRTLPKWLGITFVTTALFVNLLIFNFLAKDQTADQYMFALVVWVSVTIYLVFGEVRTRCTPFDMALPISSRKLWLSHLLAVLVSGVAIFAATAGPIAGVLWVAWKLSGKWLVTAPGLGGLAFQVCAGLILAVVLLQNPVPATHRLLRTRVRVMLAILVMVSVLALVLVLNGVSPWTALVTLFLAGTSGLYRYRSVPEVFELTEVESAVSEPVEGKAITEQWAATGVGKRHDPAAFDRHLNWTIWRCFLVGIKLKHSPWLTALFTLFFGVFLSGLDGRWLSDGSLQFMYIPMVAYVLMSFTAHPFSTTYLVDPLPVSRRRILNVLVFPYFLVLAIGYGAGLVTVRMLEAEGRPQPEVLNYIHYRSDGNYYLWVPAEALEFARDGEAPRVVSPWGEEHEVRSWPLFRGSRTKVYNQYHTASGCSIEFAAWQISRAVEKIYGETIPPELIAKMYLRERTDGSAALVGENLTIQADFPHLRRAKPGGPVFPALMGCAWTLWMLAIAGYLRAFRPGVSKAKRRAVVIGILSTLMLIWIAESLILPIARLVSMEGYIGLLSTAFNRAGQSVGATAAVWLISLMVSAAAYLLAVRQFQRAEAPHERKAGAACL
jgi:hypothetical protein